MNVNNPDFDSSARALWTLYGEEAQRRDEAKVGSLTKKMEDAITLVRSYLSVHKIKHDVTKALPYRLLYYAVS